MNRNSIAAVTTFCVTLLVNGFAVAADSAGAIESVEVAKKAAWVPPGFESLNEPQVTEIDLYYGGEYLASVFARFNQRELSFLDADSITLLLNNIRDPESINLLLQGTFATNADEICYSDFQVDCGVLQPETADIIFNRNFLRADLFINADLLVAGQQAQGRFLPDSSAAFSLFTDNALNFSGIDMGQTTFNLANTTRIALAESRLLLRSNLTDADGFVVDTVALQKEYRGKDYQVGLFRDTNSSSRFMDSQQFLGASIASSVMTRIDLDQSLGTEIELFFGSRSRIEILRDERLLASGYYDIGNQIIDTSMLPPGSYEIEIRITDNFGAMTTEYRFFSKTSKLPPEDQSIYYLQAGKIADISNIEGGFPEMGTSVIRGGFSKRLTPSLGADLGFSSTEDTTLYQAGLFKMGSNYEISAEVAMEDNGAMGSDVNLRWDLDFIRLSLSSRRIREGDAEHQLGESRTQNSLNLDIPSRWGNIGLFARTYKRKETIYQELYEGIEEIKGRNYGLRWQSNSFAIGSGDMSASFEVSKNDDDLLAMFSMNYRINGGRSQHSFTPGISYENYAAENLQQSRFQGSQLSNWISGDAEQRRLTLRTDYNSQASIEGRYEDQQSIGDTDISARYNVDSNQLEYSGKLRTSFGYDGRTGGLGGQPRGASAFIVKVDGVPDGSEFEVMVNGSSRGKTLAGKRLLIPVPPYETYRVELNAVGETIIDIDDQAYLKTVYPGNVITLEWSARIIKIIIGRIVDEAGAPIEDALIRNVRGFGSTGNQGYFQAEVDDTVKSLIIQKGLDICEADFELNNTDKQVISLGKLTCVTIEDPIAKLFPRDQEMPADADVAAVSELITEVTNQSQLAVPAIQDSQKTTDYSGDGPNKIAALAVEIVTQPVAQNLQIEEQAPEAEPLSAIFASLENAKVAASSSMHEEAIQPSDVGPVIARLPVPTQPKERFLDELSEINVSLIDSIEIHRNIGKIRTSPVLENQTTGVAWPSAIQDLKGDRTHRYPSAAPYEIRIIGSRRSQSLKPDSVSAIAIASVRDTADQLGRNGSQHRQRAPPRLDSHKEFTEFIGTANTSQKGGLRKTGMTRLRRGRFAPQS